LSAELEGVDRVPHAAFVLEDRSQVLKVRGMLHAREAFATLQRQPAVIAAAAIGLGQGRDTGVAEEDAAGTANHTLRRVDHVEGRSTEARDAEALHDREYRLPAKIKV
jgi:hypothetical protein